MSLDTSSGAYEQLYDNSAPEETDKYYEGYIEMKGKLMVCHKASREVVKIICIYVHQYDRQLRVVINMSPLKEISYIF